MEGQWFSRDLERNILEHGNWSQLVKIALRAPEAPLDPEIIHLSSYQSYDFFFFFLQQSGSLGHVERKSCLDSCKAVNWRRNQKGMM